MGWTWEVRQEVRDKVLSLELSWPGAGCWGCVWGAFRWVSRRGHGLHGNHGS